MNIANDIKTITYKYLNSQYKEITSTRNVSSVKRWNDKEVDIYLENGQTICVGLIRTELYGKSGMYKIVEII